jgi:hypothetical protein
MKNYRVSIYHEIDGKTNFKSFYYSSEKTIGTEEMHEEICRVALNIGVKNILTYSIAQVADLTFVSVELGLGW